MIGLNTEARNLDILDNNWNASEHWILLEGGPIRGQYGGQVTNQKPSESRVHTEVRRKSEECRQNRK